MTSFCAFDCYTLDGNNAFPLVLTLDRDEIQKSSLPTGPSPNRVTKISSAHRFLMALVRPTFHPFSGRWAAGYPISYGSDTYTNFSTLEPSPSLPTPLSPSPLRSLLALLPKFTHSPSFSHLPLHTLSHHLTKTANSALHTLPHRLFKPAHTDSHKPRPPYHTLPDQPTGAQIQLSANLT